jgi:flavin-binding protein dodecin
VLPRAEACSQEAGGKVMTVAKVIEISSSSTKGIEDAVKDGLKRASKSINNIRGAWVNEIKVITDGGGKVTEWRVNMRINFVLE